MPCKYIFTRKEENNQWVSEGGGKKSTHISYQSLDYIRFVNPSLKLKLYSGPWIYEEKRSTKKRKR
jgi:hypothetical protein